MKELSLCLIGIVLGLACAAILFAAILLTIGKDFFTSSSASSSSSKPRP